MIIEARSYYDVLPAHSEIQPCPAVELVTPPALSGILHSVTQRNVNWDALAERLQSHHTFTQGADGLSDATRCTGAVLEGIITMRLERYSSTRPEINARPIIDFQETEDFIFLPTGGSNLNVRRKDASVRKHPLARRHFEYDALITVNGVPAILEAKTGIGKRDSLKKALMPSEIDIISEPIRALYGTDKIAHAIISASNAEPIDAIRDYERFGGHYEKFDISYRDLRTKSIRLARALSRRRNR